MIRNIIYEKINFFFLSDFLITAKVPIIYIYKYFYNFVIFINLTNLSM